MLCPLKPNKIVTTGLANEDYKPQAEHIVSFGECDREKCAWWKNNILGKRCAMLEIAIKMPVRN